MFLQQFYRITIPYLFLASIAALKFVLGKVNLNRILKNCEIKIKRHCLTGKKQNSWY